MTVSRFTAAALLLTLVGSPTVADVIPIGAPPLRRRRPS